MVMLSSSPQPAMKDVFMEFSFVYLMQVAETEEAALLEQDHQKHDFCIGGRPLQDRSELSCLRSVHNTQHIGC